MHHDPVVIRRRGLRLAGQTSYEPTSDEGGRVEKAEGARVIYVAIGVSGMTALSAQVLWTRLLSLLFGATVYTFSLILGVFLFQIRQQFDSLDIRHLEKLKDQ